MQRRKTFLVLATIGAVLLLVPILYRVATGPSDPILPHTAEYFPVQDPATGKWGFIDARGDAVTPMVFDWAGDFRQGRGLAESGGAMGYIDASFEETGKWAIAPRFDLLDPGDQPAHAFFDGRALVRDDSGKWGYIDTTGRWAIEPRFEEAPRDYPGLPSGDFSDGLAWFQVVEMSERYVLDTNEEMVRDDEGKPVMQAYPRREFGYINRAGKVVIPPRYEMAHDFGEGLAAVRIKSHDRWGFIDRDGKRVIPPQFQAVDRFSEGLCAVAKNGTWGYIDPDGDEAIAYRFDEARQFLEGLAAARLGDRWGYIDTTGAWVIEPTYDNFDDGPHPRDPGPFENGIARVTLDGKRIYIDRRGEQVWPQP
ncbi:MAG: WG repeat-containing protein [Phycisphaeraceae bacterium]